jgi:hypothetical protein
MDMLFKAAPSCSPEEVRAEAKELHNLYLQEIATLKKDPESDLRNSLITGLENEIAKTAGLLTFKSEATGKGRGSSYSVPAAGEEEAGQLEMDIVTRQEEVYTSHFNDGSTKDVNVVVTDAKGNRLSDEVISKTARGMAQDIKTREHKAAQGMGGRRVVGQNVEGNDPTTWTAGADQDEGGITRAPSKRTEELTTQIGRGTRSEAEKRAPRTPEGKEVAAKQSASRQTKTAKRTAEIAKIKASGEDGAISEGVSKGKRKFTVVLKDGSQHKGIALAGMSLKEGRDHAIKVVKAGLGADATNQASLSDLPLFGSAQGKENTADRRAISVNKPPKPITSLEDLPNHNEDKGITGDAHKKELDKYTASVEKFYRDRGATPEKIESTRSRALTKLLMRKRNGKITKPELKRLKSESDTVNKQADEALSELNKRLDRWGEGSSSDDHARLVKEAAKNPDKLGEIHANNLKEYIDSAQASSVNYPAVDDMIASLSPPGGKRRVSAAVKDSLSPLRRALGLPTEFKPKGNLRGVGGVTSAPTKVLSGDTKLQALGREPNPDPHESFRSKEKQELSAKSDIRKQGLDPKTGAGKDLFNEAMSDIEDGSKLKPGQRGRTSAEAVNKKQLIDWVSRVKRNVRGFLTPVIEKHGAKGVETEFGDIMSELAKKIAHSMSPNPVFSTLSENSQLEILSKITNINKSVIHSLTDTGADLMAGLFLPTNLFKALNLSEKHKIEKYKNSFGQGTTGVGPVTMNSGAYEEDDEEDKDEEVKKSLNLGFYVGI